MTYYYFYAIIRSYLLEAYMKKNLIIALVAIMVFILLTQGYVMNAFLNLILAGVIPGTTVVVPYWLMMSTYSAAIAIIVTIHVERFLAARYNNKHAKAQQARMPRRRYSHI